MMIMKPLISSILTKLRLSYEVYAPDTIKNEKRTKSLQEAA
jgi:hypothetical protein